MLVNDLSHNIQTKSGAFAKWLGSKEWLENAFLNFFGHPHARVRHANNDMTCFMEYLNSQYATVIHCLNGIVYQVGPNLVEFVYISLYLRHFIKPLDDFNTVFEFILIYGQYRLHAIPHVARTDFAFSSAMYIRLECFDNARCFFNGEKYVVRIPLLPGKFGDAFYICLSMITFQECFKVLVDMTYPHMDQGARMERSICQFCLFQLIGKVSPQFSFFSR